MAKSKFNDEEQNEIKRIMREERVTLILAPQLNQY